MTAQDASTPDVSNPSSPPVPVVEVVFADPAEHGLGRRRVVGLVTLLVTAAWCAGAGAIYKTVGTLVFVKSIDTYVGELASASAMRPASTTSAPTTGPTLPANPLAWFVAPFANLEPAASRPASRPATSGRASESPNVKAVKEALAVGTWAESIRVAWLATMGVVALILLTAALLGLGGSERTAGAHHVAAWAIVAATLATFVAISLLIDKAAFPPMPTTTYVLITLIQSGYGWILLFFDPASPSEP